MSCRIRGPNAPRDLGPLLSLDHCDFVLALQLEPELRTIAKIAAEAHRCIGGDRAPTIQNVDDAARRHPKIERNPACTKITRRQFTFQEAARMYCWRHGLTSMIVNDLDIVRIGSML
jgi:hypothetical protein